MLLPMLLICLNEAVAIEYNELPPESLEVIRNNPSIIERYKNGLMPPSITDKTKTDRNKSIQQRRNQNLFDNSTPEQFNRSYYGVDQRRTGNMLDNSTLMFDNNTFFSPSVPLLPNPFVKKQLTYEFHNETKMIGVYGFVKQPNTYKVDKNFNILDVVAEAGGPLELHKLQKVSVYRKGAEVADYTYNPNNIFRMSQFNLNDNDTVMLEGRYEEIIDNQTLENQPIEIFGHNIFNNTDNFIPDQNSVNLSEYVVGPGDLLQVYIWGRITKTLSLPVNSDGSIISPEIGRIQVSGKRFDSVASVIKGTIESSEGIYAEVLIENVRSIRILVLGEVARPGYYSMSSFSNISSAIVQAGGVTERANIRNIEIKNNGQTVNSIDFYRLITTGDSSGDSLLRPGDTVFVPRTNLRVLVEGKVRTPAYFEIKQGETIADVLRYAGGLQSSGYKKNIFLRSTSDDGKVITKSLEYGSATLRSAKLRDGDKVVVIESDRPDSNSIELKGNVLFSGMYSIEKGIRLSNIITSAEMLKTGTALDYGFIERYTGEGKVRQIIGFDLGKVLSEPQNLTNNMLLEPMDIINILTREQVMAQHFVNVSGEVNAAGKYKIAEVANAYDAIMKAGGFSMDASRENIEVVRKIGNKFQTKFVNAEEARTLELHGDDSIVVHSKWAESPKGFVEVSGEVNNPGSFVYSENLTVAELVKKAGGLKKEAYKATAHLFRVKDENFNYSIERLSLEEAMKGSEKDNLALRDGDKLFVHSVFEFNPQRYVSINGAINSPGKYIFAEGMTIKDLLITSGNLKANAFRGSADIVRTDIVDGVIKNQLISVDLDAVFKGMNVVQLQPYDQVHIKEIQGLKEEVVVKVTGEVLFPGDYVVAKGEKLSSLLMRAGGGTAQAYINGMHFTRESVKAVETENLRSMKQRLESMISAMTSQQIAQSLSAQDIAANESLSKNLENTIKRLDEIEPQGRIVIDVASLSELENSNYDFELEPGDQIHIPVFRSTVTLIGEVYQATSFAYDPKKPTVRDYLGRSGGVTEIGDKKNIYVVRANGSVISNQYIKDNFWWKDINDVSLQPGDVLVVPTRLKFPTYMRDIKDITQILYQIATTFAVTKLMF